MGMMLRRWRERAPEAEHEADKPEAAEKKPTKLKRAASSEK